MPTSFIFGEHRLIFDVLPPFEAFRHDMQSSEPPKQEAVMQQSTGVTYKELRNVFAIGTIAGLALTALLKK